MLPQIVSELYFVLTFDLILHEFLHNISLYFLTYLSCVNIKKLT